MTSYTASKITNSNKKSVTPQWIKLGKVPECPDTNAPQRPSIGTFPIFLCFLSAISVSFFLRFMNSSTSIYLALSAEDSFLRKETKIKDKNPVLLGCDTVLLGY
jgi:hypothetical protein